MKALRFRILNDTAGAVMVEYVVLLGCVTIGLAAALVLVGPPLVKAYERTRDIMYAPFP